MNVINDKILPDETIDAAMAKAGLKLDHNTKGLAAYIRYGLDSKAIKWALEIMPDLELTPFDRLVLAVLAANYHYNGNSRCYFGYQGYMRLDAEKIESVYRNLRPHTWRVWRQAVAIANDLRKSVLGG